MEFHYKFATAAAAAAVYCNYSRRRHIATYHHGDDHHEEQEQQRGNGATIKCDELGVSSMDELSSVPEWSSYCVSLQPNFRKVPMRAKPTSFIYSSRSFFFPFALLVS